jgi:hypothetical protein
MLVSFAPDGPEVARGGLCLSPILRVLFDNHTPYALGAWLLPPPLTPNSVKLVLGTVALSTHWKLRPTCCGPRLQLPPIPSLQLGQNGTSLYPVLFQRLSWLLHLQEITNVHLKNKSIVNDSV